MKHDMQELLKLCSDITAIRTNGQTHLRLHDSGRLIFAGSAKECAAFLRGIIVGRGL